MSADTINVLHISDLHYDGRRKHDNEVVLKAFLKDIEALASTDLNPDIIIFSGDLAQSGDASDDYLAVVEYVLHPLLTITKVDEHRLFLVPGNHDVRRSVVQSNDVMQSGLDTRLTNRYRLNSFYVEHPFYGYIREKLSHFLALKDYIQNKNLVGHDLFSDVYFIRVLDIAIIGLNTAWMSRAGLYEHSDRGRLLIPEACIRKSLGTLPATKGRIIVGHQPVDWLAEYSCDDVRRILEREATLYLHGHMHEPIAATVRSTIGGALSNQSGALYTGRSRYNGYAVIRLEPQRGMAEVNLRSFYERREVFDQAIDIIDDGRWYSSDEAEAYFAEAHPGFDARSVLRWMSERLSSELRETLDEGFSDRPVSEVFVAPRLAKDSPQSVVADDGPYEDDAQQCALSDLVSGSDNYIVVGKREFGKTTLLRQVALQMVQASIELGRPIVPCLIDFSDIRPGKNRLHRLLRTQLPDMDGYGFGFADLLSRGFLVVLIDDFHFSDAKRRQIVEEFISTHPRCRYILTSKAEILDDLGVNATLDAGTPFIRLSMEPFSRREMRRLVERWDTRGNLDTEAVLDRMVSNIVHINVPLTAVNGTILLTIYEAHGDFVPINKAVLVQTFIETLLDKHSLHQARRERFDFRNQAYVLAYLADHMATSDRYRIVWDEAIEVAHGYFRMMGLPDRASLELRNFIACKILDEKQGEVRFRYRAFLEYFLAARMVEEQPFRKWVF